VGRAINRFALVAAAGELATKLGVTGWPEGEAVRAVRVCLKAWLAERGHLGNKEDEATLVQICAFISAYQYSRFADWFDPNHRPVNMVGFRRVEPEGVSFYILPLGWLEITKGRDPKRAAFLCLEAGYLLTDKDKKRLQRQVRLPGLGKGIRVYVLGERVLGEEGDDPDD
jgi:putative DNA primase/helicase